MRRIALKKTATVVYFFYFKWPLVKVLNYFVDFPSTTLYSTPLRY